MKEILIAFLLVISSCDVTITPTVKFTPGVYLNHTYQYGKIVGHPVPCIDHKK